MRFRGASCLKPFLALAGLVCCLLSLPFTAVAGQRLRAGQTVRVWLADGQRFEARLVGVDSNPIVLRFAQSPQSVPISSINSLWVRRRGTARGALIGGIVVGSVSLGLLSLVCVALGEGEGCNSWGYVTAGTVVGAAGGALVGAGVGILIPRWRRVDPQRLTISFGAADGGLRIGARIGF
ncbi:MAG TPA: hypothetical protein VGQ29_05225 [Gemmatimonadales bacterium]|nr:hypothetical protein [Gemmatimonadales bacterium]